MADLKISALPASSTPLTGTEVLPIVQNSTTKNVSVANLTSGRTVNAGALNVNVASAYGTSKLSVNGDFTLADSMGLCWGTNATSFTGLLGDRSNGTVSIYTGGTEKIAVDLNGNLSIKTAGKGIDFSATASGSGTMTSELLSDYEEGTFTPTFTTGTFTYKTQLGIYTKIGNVVSVQIQLSTDSATGSGTVTIAGLPFTSSIRTVSSINGNSWVNIPYGAVVNANNTVIELFKSNNMTSPLQVSDMYNLSGGYNELFINVTYRVA